MFILQTMKNVFYIACLAVVAWTAVSCSEEGEPARTPVASANLSDDHLVINESMEISFTGVADQVVIYTGDDGHVYDLRETENNTGIVVNKGYFTYSYSTPGTFRVVCVASTYDTFLGGHYSSDICEYNVTVVDDVTTIDQISSSITPNVYYATLETESDWVMCLPEKQVYNNKEIAVNAKKARLSFSIASDSSKIYVNDVAYSTKSYYNLTEPIALRVTSDAGTERMYTLHTLIYPEFKSLEAIGMKPVLTRSAYFQDLLTYTFTLPEGADVSSISLDWAVDDDVTVEKVSNTEYILTRTDAANAAIKAVSHAVIEFN